MDPKDYTKLDAKIVKWLERDEDPKLLHRGSQAELVEELKAWIDRRLKFYNAQMEYREECQKHQTEMLETMTCPSRPRGEAAARKNLEFFLAGSFLAARNEGFDKLEKIENLRGLYFVESLNVLHKITWPDMGGPPGDADVVSALVTMKVPDFDGDATLAALRMVEWEQKLRKRRAELDVELAKYHETRTHGIQVLKVEPRSDG